VRSPQVSLPAAYEAPAGAAAAEPALDQWWRLYPDPQLTALIEEALAAAPDARIAEARLREALSVRSAALSDYNLKGDFGSQFTDAYSRTLAGTDLNIPGVQTGGETRSAAASLPISWELDLFGRRGATARGADADLAAVRFETAAAEASLAANVADSLFAARGLAAQLADAQETARISGTLAEAAEARFKAGIAPASDAQQAAADAELARANAANLVGQLQAARRSLLVLLGRGTAPSVELPISAELGEPVPAPATLPGALLVRRPDVQEARERLVSAAAKLKLDELALLPTVQLTSALSLSKLETAGFSATTAAGQAGAALLLPIFSRPRLMSEVHAQGARAEQAVLTYEKTVQTAYGEAESALDQTLQDRARISSLVKSESDAHQAFEGARARYIAGVDDATAAFVAERSWRVSHAALTQARTDALRRTVTLFKALGGGWPGARS
jgi:NodT family efflux transporter outer membrane factor (OMF) lipoprotein